MTALRTTQVTEGNYSPLKRHQYLKTTTVKKRVKVERLTLFMERLNVEKELKSTIDGGRLTHRLTREHTQVNLIPDKLKYI